MLKTDKRKTHFTILTTTDCNARCFYCYEMGIPRFVMTEETARDVGEYIAKACGGKTVKLSWFGGEPLFNRPAIDVICDTLRGHGVEYSSILTSNAYYLDAETARKAAQDWHIRHAQITVDGTETVYNRTKAYIDRGEESPYQRVLENIGHALNAGIEVAIRLNMDSANADDLMALADELAERFHGRNNLFAHVIMLRAVAGPVHQFDSEQEAFARKKALEEKLDGYGLLKQERFKQDFRVNQCMADNDACEVVLPDGRIQKCEHFNEAEVIGSIHSDVRDEEKRRAWKETMRFPECADCALYPKCVSLRRCEWWRDGCSAVRKSEQLEKLKKSVITAYEQTITNDGGSRS